MNEAKDGGPAFPRPHSDVGPWDGRCEREHASEGMTLRDYFAGVALPQAMTQVWQMVTASPELAVAAGTDEGLAILLQRVSSMSYSMADAMLAEKAKGGAT